MAETLRKDLQTISYLNPEQVVTVIADFAHRTLPENLVQDNVTRIETGVRHLGRASALAVQDIGHRRRLTLEALVYVALRDEEVGLNLLDETRRVLVAAGLHAVAFGLRQEQMLLGPRYRHVHQPPLLL